MKNTLTRHLSNTLSTQSFVAHTHTHTDYTLHTYMQVRMGEKTTLANDVHQIASKVWTRVWTTHLSSHTSLFFFPFQLYIYLCSGWVMRWAPICNSSQPRSDRNRTSSLSYYQPPPFFPSTPTLHPPLRLMQILSLWFHSPFLVRYGAFSPSILLATRWQAENG